MAWPSLRTAGTGAFARGPSRGLWGCWHQPAGDTAGRPAVGRPSVDREYAACLYRALRDADELGLTDIWAVPPDDGSASATAVRDRLSRAAAR